MTDTDGRTAPRGGLARAIEALFAASPLPTGGRLPGAAYPLRTARTGEGEREALARALDAFLAGRPPEREGFAEEVRARAKALREGGRLDPLAEAVERLALHRDRPPDPAARALAAELLSPGVASRIAARLGAAEGEARQRLVEVSGALGREMVLALFDALREATDRASRRAYLEALAGLGPGTASALDEMLDDGRWFVVRDAVAVLGRMEGPAARERVAAQLAHPDPRVRREALFAVARAADEDAGLLVYGMIEDPDRDVRLAAAMAAGALRVERALRPLLALLEEEAEEGVQVGILEALGRLGDPGAVPALEKRARGSFFSRPAAPVRLAAFRALRRIGTPRARAILDEAARDEKDPGIREAVRELLAPEA